MSNITSVIATLGLNREELAKISPDHKVIKAFETLFRQTTILTEESSGAGSDVSDIAQVVGSVYNKAVQAVSELQQAEQTAKGANVLVWLSAQ